jgi:uncharacterized membrane protein (DUF106 family)
MLAFIQANSFLIGYIITSIIAVIGFIIRYKLKISEIDNKMGTMKSQIIEHKVDADKKIKVLEDAVRCRDEAILNKLDSITNELMDMKIQNAKLLGILAGSGVIKSEDI